MVKTPVRSAISLIAMMLLLAILSVSPRSALASEVVVGPFPESGPGNAVAQDLSWFQWNDDVNALADDGDAIWMGTAMGVVRWDKNAGAVQRFTRFDGLLSSSVYAVAVDAAGNRWFGGDGGLSRLDADGRWTHYSPANSGLAEVLVDGIAVGADGTLWLSHGLPDGPVSRLGSNGTWIVYPDVTAAIIHDFQAIVTTQNKNPLWLVAGDEVWMGFWVYDGAVWHDRSPDAAGRTGLTVLPDASRPRPKALDTDSTGVVWTMVESPQATIRILSWNGAGWTDHTPHFCWEGELETLAVSGDDTVWIGYKSTSTPPGPFTAYPAVNPLPIDGCLQYPVFNRRPPVQVLLAAADGAWSAGPGWLRQPNGDLIDLETLAYSEVSDVLVDANDNLWVHSHQVFREYGVREYAIQLLDDQQTSTIHDDQWNRQDGLPMNVLTGWDRLLDGDVIVTGYYDGRFRESIVPHRGHNNAWIEYDPNYNFGLDTDFYYDVFVQDNSHFWFAAQWDEPVNRGVIGLDDRGTPLNPDDDIWTLYRVGAGEPVNSAAPPAESAVAVDSLNRIWYADASGVYMLGANGWQHKFDTPACDLVPGRWGVVNVILPYQGTSCDQLDMTVFIIDGSHIYHRDLDDFARSHAQVATSPNRLWSVAPDGTVWYYWRPDNTVRSVVPAQSGSPDSYPVPADAGPVSSIQAGSGNRVWIVAGSELWRLSPQPDFGIAGLSGAWIVASGSDATRRGRVVGTGTWNWPVSLRVTGLPPELSASFDPTPVQPGSVVAMTVEVSPVATAGSYPALLVAEGAAVVHTQPLTITVAPQVYTNWLPKANQQH